MKGTEIFCCCFVFALQLASWVSATSRTTTFAPTYHHRHLLVATNQPGPSVIHESARVSSNSKEGLESMKEEKEETYYYGGGKVGKLGSSTPSCEHKCYECTPCEAIQVPTISRGRSHMVHVQYANYEPEGWKCKCGPSFFSP